MQQLSPQDAWFVFADSPTFRQAFISAYVFVPEEPSGQLPDRAEMIHWFQGRATLPVLRRRLLRVPLDLGRPYWIDDPDFAVSRHLYFHERMDWAGLRQLMGDLAAAPMDMSLPLWELHVVAAVAGIPGVKGPALVAAIKMHHAAADGIASMDVTSALFGANVSDQDDSPTTGRVPSRAELAARAVGATPMGIARLVSGLWRTRQDYRNLLKAREREEYRLPRREKTPTVLDGPVGPGRVCEVEYFSLEELQSIKSAVAGGLTVSDLTLTVIGGALRAYLLDQNEAVGGSLAASVPMSIRALGVDDTHNNKFVMMTVDLHTDIDDPVARARAVHDAVLAERRRLSVPEETSIAFSEVLIPGWIFRAARLVQRLKGASRTGVVGRGKIVNTFVTSVPRRSRELRLAGTKSVRVLGTGTLDGTGTSHSVGTIDDLFALNVTADPALLRNSGRYMECVRQSYEELREAARAQSKTG